MDITQSFYDSMADRYDKLFENWQAATREQAALLSGLFQEQGFDKTAAVLDCACGIGTQTVGLAALGYNVTGSDISAAELSQAKKRAESQGVKAQFAYADFRALSKTFSEPFDIVICMDNALPHMLTRTDLEAAVESIAAQMAAGGLFAASIRDYDALLQEKPPYSPPYIHKTEKGQRVAFQTWFWEGIHYKFTQYIIEDEQTLQISKFDCEYRAILRDELTALLQAKGLRVQWRFPEDTGFYQPILLARKPKGNE